MNKREWIDSRKTTYNGIGLDVLLYDAQQGARLSTQILFKLYIDNKLNNRKPLPKLVNNWLLESMKRFFAGDIDLATLITQSKSESKSNRNDRFNPFYKNSRINLPVIDYIHIHTGTPKSELPIQMSKSGIREMMDGNRNESQVPSGEFSEPQFGYISEASIQKDQTTLKKRTQRLKRIEYLLGMLYSTECNTPEKERIIFEQLENHYLKSLQNQNLNTPFNLI